MPGPDAEKNVRNPKWLYIGVICMAVGFTAIVCRYVFLPLSLPGPWSSVVTGVCFGLIFGGLSALKQGRQSGARLSVRAGLAAIAVAAALVVGGFWLFAPPGTRADAPLQVQKLPGMSIPLPAGWTVEESTQAWEVGLHKVLDPEGGDRFLTVHWTRSEPLTSDELLKSLTGLGEQLNQSGKLLGKTGITVSDHSAETLEVSLGGKHALITHWHCPTDTRNLQVISFLNLTPEDHKELHRRILTDVECHTEPVRFEPIFPKVEVEETFTQIDGPDARGYEGPEGQILLTLMGMRGQNLATRDDNALRAVVSSAFSVLEFEQLVLGEELIRSTDRVTSTGQATDPEDGVRLGVAITLFYCPALHTSFIAMFFGPEKVVSSSVGSAALSRVTCPDAPSAN